MPASSSWKDGGKRPRRAFRYDGETIFDYTNRLFDEGNLEYREDTGDVIVKFNFLRKDGVRKTPKIVRTIDRKGYYYLKVTVDGCRHSVLIHRMVYAYRNRLSEFPKGLVINHINGIKTDNKIENLELVTYSENTRHAIATGLKEKRPTCKLNWDKVREIRNVIANKEKQHWKIAEEYGVVKSTIDRIAQNRSWRDDEWYAKRGKKRK